MNKERSRASLSEFLSIIVYIKPFIPQYIFGLLALLLVDAAQILIPQYIRKAIDLMASGEASATSILSIAVSLLVTAACISLGRFFWRFFIHGSSRRIEARLRNDLFNHIISRDMYFFNGNTTGDLMARSTSDLNHVRMAIGMGVVAFVDGTVMAISILSVMFIQQPFLAALVVLPLPLITFLILRFGSLLGKRFQRAQEAFSRLGQIVQETFSGIRLVKAYVQEQWFEKRFAQSNDEYKQANMAVVKIFGLFFPLIAFLSGIGSAVLLLVGSRMVLSGSLSAGEMVAMFSYLQMLIWPIIGAGFTINTFQRGAVSLKRVNEIFNAENLIDTASDAHTNIDIVQGAPLIEFRNTNFSYPDGTPVLQDISFSLHKGEILGILGRTGSGKSTLLKLFTRLVEPNPETVFFNGRDIRGYEIKTLRKEFSFAAQDTYLFSQRIDENISFSSDVIDDDRVAFCVAQAALEKDLLEFQQGIHTVVGEKGLSLSGGQKQRVSLARALYYPAQILVLDDVFSAVDVATEEKILDGIIENRNGRTLVFVSNRASTLARADRVLVLQDGKIAEIGSPMYLAAQDGVFSKTLRLQSLEHSSEQGPLSAKKKASL